MQDKSNNTIKFRAGKADKNFTEERLTSYTGLTVVSKYIQAQGLGKLLDRLFPTVKQNATKFSSTQIMLTVVLAGEKESVCEFEYQAKKWKKSRTLRGIRILTGYKETNFFGETILEPEYEYFCYCSNLNDKDGKALDDLYKKRAESENWIEQTKNQLHASQTLTDDFSANDILWQLAVLGYNLSVMMRYEAKVGAYFAKIHRCEAEA